MSGCWPTGKQYQTIGEAAVARLWSAVSCSVNKNYFSTPGHRLAKDGSVSVVDRGSALIKVLR
jgi:hypothetical protein